MTDEDDRIARLSEADVRRTAARFESLSATTINAWLIDLLPDAPANVLDVGAGTGRDATWLTSIGHDVVAVEPDRAMRHEVERWHVNRTFRLLNDRLPDLPETVRTGFTFDFILANAVWMFVAPSERERAFRRLITLLNPGGLVAMTLRRPIEAVFGMHPVSTAEIQRLAGSHRCRVERIQSTPDFWGRDVTWTQIAVVRPIPTRGVRR